MLVHKTKSQSRRTTSVLPSFYLFAIIAFVLLAVALGLPRLYNREATISDPAQRTFANFRDEQNRFSISYPLEWQVMPGNEGLGVTTIMSTPSQKAITEGGNFSTSNFRAAPTPLANFSKIDVLTFQVEPGTTARQLMLSRSALAPSGQLQSVKVAGQDALRLDVESVDGVKGQDVVKSYSSVFVVIGDRGYIIGGFADEVTFNRVLQSFRTW